MILVVGFARQTKLASSLVNFFGSMLCIFSLTDWLMPDAFSCGCSMCSGRGEAVCAGRPAVRRVPGCTLWRQVCTILLRQCHLPPVLLRALLDADPLEARPRVSQAACQGRCRPTSVAAIPLVLRPVARSARRRSADNTSVVFVYPRLFFSGFSNGFFLFLLHRSLIYYVV